MQNLRFLVFLALTLPLNAQHTSSTQEDFNGDGIQDELLCTYEIGSAFGGSSCELIDGNTGKAFKLTNYGCFCAMKKWVSVAKELRLKANEYFLYTLKKEVLPVFRPTPDQSLVWIINSSLQSKKLYDHDYFNLVFKPNTTWRQGKIDLPSTYYIEMNAQTLSKIVRPESAPDTNITPDQKDFLVYYGDTHFSTDSLPNKQFKTAAANDRYQILTTAHGVLAKKDASYKWLFVTDIDGNAAPQKLRWPSIEDVVLHGDYVIIKQGLAPETRYHIYIVAIENGSGVRLKIDFDALEANGLDLQGLTPSERFSIVDNTLIIGREKNVQKFPLAELKQDLEVLTKEN